MIKRPDVSERNRKNKGIYKINIPKEYLEKEYLSNYKSMNQISKELNVSLKCIKRRFDDFNIPLRTRSESQKGILNHTFGKKMSDDFVIYNSKSHIQNCNVKNVCGFSLGYLVAIIEGEGYFSLIKKNNNKNSGFNFTPVIGVTNTDIDLLKFVQSVIGCGKIYTRPYSKTNPKIMGNYHLNGIKNIHNLTNQLIPYLFAKREKAKTLRNYCKFILDKHKMLDDKIKYQKQIYCFVEKTNKEE